MAAPDVFSSFMGGFNETYGMVSKMKSEKEKSALTQASTLLSEVDSWQKLKADSNLMEEQARQIVNDLDLGDDEGSRAALKAVYSKLKANQNSKDRFALVKKDLEESGTTSFRLNTIKKEEAPVTPVALGVDSQTEEAIPGIKNPDNAITPAKQNSIDTGLGKVIEEKDAPDNTEKGLKVSKFLKLFDKQGKIDARALEIAETAIGGEDMLSGYMDYRRTGEIPTLAEFADLPDDVSIVAGYSTPLGKGWTVEKIAKDLGTAEQAHAFLATLKGPEHEKARKYLVEYAASVKESNSLYNISMGVTKPDEIRNAALFDAKVEAGILRATDGKPNLETFGGNFKAWEKADREIGLSYADSPKGKLLAGATTPVLAEQARGQIDSLVAAGELTEEEGVDLDTALSDLKENMIKVKSAEAEATKNPTSYVDRKKANIILADGSAVGVGSIDTNGDFRLHGKKLEATVNGQSYFAVSDDELSRFDTVSKEIKGFNTKLQGFNSALVRMNKMSKLVERTGGDVLTEAAGISQGLTMFSKSMDFFLENAVSGDGPIDIKRVYSGMDENKRGIITNMLGLEIPKLSADAARFASLKIQAAYALAQALGQEGKGLSDTDLALQLKSIAGTSNPAAFQDMLHSIVDNVYKGVRTEKATYLDKFKSNFIRSELVDLQPQIKEDYIRSTLAPSSQTYLDAALAYTAGTEAISPVTDTKEESKDEMLTRIKAEMAARNRAANK